VTSEELTMQELAEFKQEAQAAWAAGDYDAMMRQEGLYEVGAHLVRRTGVGAGQDVLDVACGTGNAAIPAARAGARVTGLDLTPEMLAAARARGEAAAVAVEWVEGDAEDLPFGDQSFDLILSTFGCMFAPRTRSWRTRSPASSVPGAGWGSARGPRGVRSGISSAPWVSTSRPRRSSPTRR
jgi:SAM-dependent methyltransferase